MSFAEMLTAFDDALYTWCLIYMLAGTGIYFTVRMRFVQLRLLKDCFTCMFEKKSTENGISSFQALIIAIVLLSRIAFDTLKDYEKQKAQGIDPVFHERNIGIDNTDVWK